MAHIGVVLSPVPTFEAQVVGTFMPRRQIAFVDAQDRRVPNTERVVTTLEAWVRKRTIRGLNSTCGRGVRERLCDSGSLFLHARSCTGNAFGRSHAVA